MPLGVAESIEHVLKKFIAVKVEEEQQFLHTSNSKLRQIQKKKSANKVFFCKKNKENTEQSVHQTNEEEDFHSVFQNHHSTANPKLLSRIHEC